MGGVQSPRRCIPTPIPVQPSQCNRHTTTTYQNSTQLVYIMVRCCFHFLTQVLAKGKPEDALPGLKGRQVPLADEVKIIPGLLNSQGTKVGVTMREHA